MQPADMTIFGAAQAVRCSRGPCTVHTGPVHGCPDKNGRDMSALRETLAKLTFLGSKLTFLGAKLTFLGAKLTFLGSKLTFLGSKLTFLGSNPRAAEEAARLAGTDTSLPVTSHRARNAPKE